MMRLICVVALSITIALGACDKADAPSKSAESSTESEGPANSSERQASKASKPKVVPPPKHEGPMETHPFVLAATAKWEKAVKAAETGDLATLKELLTPSGNLLLKQGGAWAKAYFVGRVLKPVEVNGGRVALELGGARAGSHVVAFYRQGDVLLDPMASRRYRVSAKRVDHPKNISLSVADATKGVKGVGQLRMTLATSRGDIQCELYEKRAPGAVANFVGLARGLRAFKLPTEESWTKRRFYTGLAFHKVLPGKTITSGCPSSDGKGGPGFQYEDEFDLSLRHDGVGVLGLVNEGPHTNGSQFYITAGPMPKYDDKRTVFGRCSQEGLIKAISQAKTKAYGTPAEPVAINGMEFFRKP